MSRSSHPEQAEGFEIGISSKGSTYNPSGVTRHGHVKFIRNDSTGSLDNSLLNECAEDSPKENIHEFIRETQKLKTINFNK